MKLNIKDLFSLLEGIKEKMNNWTSKFLSFVSRLTLVNSVLSSSNIFWCSHFILPCGVYKKIKSLIRNFIWSGSPDDHSKAKVAWEDVTKPKSEGGLGIRCIHDTNMALMAKWVHKIIDVKKILIDKLGTNLSHTK